MESQIPLPNTPKISGLKYKFLRFVRIFLGGHIVRPAHVTNVDLIFFVTHRVSISPRKTYTLLTINRILGEILGFTKQPTTHQLWFLCSTLDWVLNEFDRL